MKTNVESKRLLKWILICSFAVIYSFYVFYAYSQHPMDSDYANLILKADDWLNGNFFLSNWYNTSNDLIFYIISVAIFGKTNFAYIFASGLMFLITFAVSLYYCHISGKKLTIFTFIIFLFIAGTPSMTWIYGGRAHFEAAIMLFISLISIHYLSKKEKNICFLVLLFVAIAVGSSEDALTMIFASLPIMLVMSVTAIRTYSKNHGKDSLCINCLTLSVLATLAGLILSKIFYEIGGAIKTTFIEDSLLNPIELYTEKTILFFRGLLFLFDADFSNTPVFSFDAFYFFIRSIIIIYGLYLVIKNTIQFIKGRKTNHTDVILSLGFLFLAFIFITTDISTDIQRVRYYGLTPFIFAILIIHHFENINIPEMADKVKNYLKAVSIFIMILCMSICIIRMPNNGIGYNEEAMYLSNILRLNGYKTGYASYWNSSILNIYSDGRLSVHALRKEPVDDGIMKVKAYKWFCKNDWYDEYADYIIVADDDYYFTYEDVIDTFGKPESEFKAEKFNILYYGRDLSKELIK